jgi:hypothetical protein
MSMRHLFAHLVVVLAMLPAPAAAQDSVAQLNAQRKLDVEAGATDASLRTPFAAPKATFEVEIADDKKTATAKIGLGWGRYATSEVGFKGAFDSRSSISRLTSLRELTPGSSLWFATTWKRYRVAVDAVRLNTVCRQAAWAAGADAGDFNCVESTLPAESFAAQLAELVSNPVERGTCQRFVRAMLTSAEVAAGVDLKQSLCDGPLNLSSLQTQYGVRFTQGYAARYAAAVAAAMQADALALCNEYRRSEGLPPAADCDPTNFGADDKKQFQRSWKDRLEKRRSEREAEVCDAYRRAVGEAPTGMGGCQPIGVDVVFSESFQSRYAAGYRWKGTPIWGFRVDAGRPTFSYLDASLESHEETHGLYSVGGHFGWLTVNDVLFALQYSLGKSWKPQDAIELCRPVPNTSATACEADVVIGAPDEKNRHQLEGQVKGYLGESAAASVILTRDFEQKAWGLEVPVYFMKNKDGGLAGGLVFLYRKQDNKPKAYGVSVFVGQVFDLF